MAYIEGRDNEEGCLFCNRLKEDDGPGNLILRRASHSFVILNRYPYNNGHMMVVPFTHKSSIDELDSEALSEMMTLSSDSISVLRVAYGAEAFNLGINIGEAAGAGIAEHVHVHVLPRWSGDTSFTATTAETRVIPEALEVTYQRLRQVWDELKQQR
jgi:ATP adenylyltransferase